MSTNIKHKFSLSIISFNLVILFYSIWSATNSYYNQGYFNIFRILPAILAIVLGGNSLYLLNKNHDYQSVLKSWIVTAGFILSIISLVSLMLPIFIVIIYLRYPIELGLMALLFGVNGFILLRKDNRNGQGTAILTIVISLPYLFLSFISSRYSIFQSF